MSEVMQRMQYVYEFAKLDRVPDGPTSAKVSPRKLLSGPSLEKSKASTMAAVLVGEKLAIALATMVRGSGSKAHTHPNEQLNYIVQGAMYSEVEGVRDVITKGMVMHNPANAVHMGVSCPDEDLMFLAMKDTRYGISGPPVDGKYDGPAYLPGFGKRAGEKAVTTADLIAELEHNPQPGAMRYVYHVELGSPVPDGPASAVVTPGRALGLPAGVTGTLITAEMLHVGVLRLAPGASIAAHVHDNEQFTFVIDGALQIELDGDEQSVGRHCALHVPAGLKHRIASREGAHIVTLQDTRRAFAA
jgi:quercetin dioxygenase-like cupin family protein